MLIFTCKTCPKRLLYKAHFNNFTPFLVLKLCRSIEVFYKPSYFKYRLLASALSEVLAGPQCALDVVNQSQKSSVTRQSRSRSPKNSTSKKAEQSPSKKGTNKIKGQKDKRPKEEGEFEDDSLQEDFQRPWFYLSILLIVARIVILVNYHINKYNNYCGLSS